MKLSEQRIKYMQSYMCFYQKQPYSRWVNLVFFSGACTQTMKYLFFFFCTFWLTFSLSQCFGFTRGSGEGRNSVPLKCCLPKTVYRVSIINNLSQDSYFWSGLRGGNLLDSSSFILRFTVLPFPAERGEKWNHMFWGASVGNPTEDKWLLLSLGN